jgi:hypothetical protein
LLIGGFAPNYPPPPPPPHTYITQGTNWRGGAAAQTRRNHFHNTELPAAVAAEHFNCFRRTAHDANATTHTRPKADAPTNPWGARCTRKARNQENHLSLLQTASNGTSTFFEHFVVDMGFTGGGYVLLRAALTTSAACFSAFSNCLIPSVEPDIFTVNLEMEFCPCSCVIAVERES